MSKNEYFLRFSDKNIEQFKRGKGKRSDCRLIMNEKLFKWSAGEASDKKCWWEKKLLLKVYVEKIYENVRVVGAATLEGGREKEKGKWKKFILIKAGWVEEMPRRIEQQLVELTFHGKIPFCKRIFFLNFTIAIKKNLKEMMSCYLSIISHLNHLRHRQKKKVIEVTWRWSMMIAATTHSFPHKISSVHWRKIKNYCITISIKENFQFSLNFSFYSSSPLITLSK